MADDGKMAAMQTAAKSLVDQLSPLAKTNGDVYISIVPFAKDVNVGASNYNKYWVDFSDWDAARGTRSANHNTWTGSVVDRDQDYDTKNTTPTSGNAGTQFPAEQYSYCDTGSSSYLQPIMPLSYDWNSLKSRIDAMKPTGNTNQGIGLAWGWMTLSTGDPMNAPAKTPTTPTRMRSCCSPTVSTRRTAGTATPGKSTRGRRSCATMPRPSPTTSRSTRCR